MDTDRGTGAKAGLGTAGAVDARTATDARAAADATGAGLVAEAEGRRAAEPDPFRTVCQVLEAIAAGRRALRAVRHPLGFLCLPVLRRGATGVCVHVFEPHRPGDPPDLATSPYHAHSWELTSSVLYGAVGNVRIRVLDRPPRPTHRVFEVHSSASGEDELRPTPRLVAWEPHPPQTAVRGDTYTLAAGEIHTTVVEGGGATLVHGRALPGRTDLSLGPLDGTAHRGVRQLCDAPQTAQVARTALRRIHEPQGD